MKVEEVDRPDALLVTKARHGDKQAFGELVQRYEKKIYSLVLSLLQNSQDAEDITQEVFVRAYFSLGHYRADSKFFTWLYRIAYNMSIDFKRRMAVRSRTMVSSNEDNQNSLNFIADSNVKLPDEVIEQQELSSSLKQALLQISEEHRAVMILREVDGLSYDEIARITGSAKGTVMSRLHYARKQLQKVLSGFSSILPGGGSYSGRSDDSEDRLLEESQMPNRRLIADSGLADITILVKMMFVLFLIAAL